MANSTAPKPDAGHRAKRRDFDEDQPALAAVTGYLADRRTSETFRLINERVRLGILSVLAVNDELSFAELKNGLQLSDGNLSVHARKLEAAGFLEVSKQRRNRQTSTLYRMTPGGRAAFGRYLDHMEALIHTMRERNET